LEPAAKEAGAADDLDRAIGKVAQDGAGFDAEGRNDDNSRQWTIGSGECEWGKRTI
jgi:hypothetical protein